ncbi:MAG: hypothetical protein HYX49_08570 [Chloroflexi bacterium]|nr:hypothetical protein [Chloroflexota bacterium]
MKKDQIAKVARNARAPARAWQSGQGGPAQAQALKAFLCEPDDSKRARVYLWQLRFYPG